MPPPPPPPVATPTPTPEPAPVEARREPPTPEPARVPIPTTEPAQVPIPTREPNQPESFQPLPTESGTPAAGARPPSTDEPVLSAIVSGAVDQVSRVIKPQAAAAVAATFGFPLILMLLVAMYLVVQARVDHRDPKLRLAPQNAYDTVVAFTDEEAL